MTKITTPTNADLLARIAVLEAEREALSLAICGGEDAPGYAASLTVPVLEGAAKSNRASHIEALCTVNRNLRHWREECGKLHSRIAALEADGIAARKAAADNYARADAAQADAEQWARKCAVADDRVEVLEAERDALVGAAYEAAAKGCDRIAGNTADFTRDHRRAAGQCAAAIRALTPEHASAALARSIRAAEADGMRKALSLMETALMHPQIGTARQIVREIILAAAAAKEAGG